MLNEYIRFWESACRYFTDVTTGRLVNYNFSDFSGNSGRNQADSRFHWDMTATAETERCCTRELLGLEGTERTASYRLMQTEAYSAPTEKPLVSSTCLQPYYLAEHSSSRAFIILT